MIFDLFIEDLPCQTASLPHLYFIMSTWASPFYIFQLASIIGLFWVVHLVALDIHAHSISVFSFQYLDRKFCISPLMQLSKFFLDNFKDPPQTLVFLKVCGLWTVLVISFKHWAIKQ
ncbi:hypothetical protein CHS0354_013284 [Potamilus streckersoni]|uniref:Uncharacterized protein n=1 Tax=Potamilus streckersoni TaxID=2493646 RepID=A0AAE0SZ90_9BIVA|nr:hypothetical protein CHS0354_013284 [Potamilus streckersoni]